MTALTHDRSDPRQHDPATVYDDRADTSDDRIAPGWTCDGCEPGEGERCFCTHARYQHDDTDIEGCANCRADTDDPATYRHVFDPA